MQYFIKPNVYGLSKYIQYLKIFWHASCFKQSCLRKVRKTNKKKKEFLGDCELK